MRTIRAIFRKGNLEPLEPLALAENASVTIALLEGDDVPAESVAQLASDDPVFEFLDDAREDLYSASDGVVV